MKLKIEIIYMQRKYTMRENVKMRYPRYLKEFKCIGGECTDSCCIGWDIDIDKVTFRQYYKVQDKEMKRMLQKNVHINDYYLSPDLDYGKVKLKSGKRCAFLDEENYCIIYSKIGENYLSNVCTSFPRITNKVDRYYEMSLDVACPEAARILLLKEEGIEFIESEEILGKHILSSDIETTSTEYNNSPVKYLKEIRDLSIKIIQNREFNLSERLYILGDFINTLEKELKHKYNDVPTFIKQYNMNSVNDSYEKNQFSNMAVESNNCCSYLYGFISTLVFYIGSSYGDSYWNSRCHRKCTYFFWFNRVVHLEIAAVSCLGNGDDTLGNRM